MPANFEQFNYKTNADLERVADEELTNVKEEELSGSRETLAQQENFAAIDKKFGVANSGEAVAKAENNLLKERLNFRIKNALNRLEEVQKSDSKEADKAIATKELKAMLQEAREELASLDGGQTDSKFEIENTAELDLLSNELRRAFTEAEKYSSFELKPKEAEPALESEALNTTNLSQKEKDSLEKSFESPLTITQIGFKAWQELLPGILCKNGVVFSPESSALDNLAYFVDGVGDYYLYYVENGAKHAKKFSVNKNSERGLEEDIDPAILEIIISADKN